MTGLEKITAQIKEESQKTAEATLANACTERERILDEAKAQAQSDCGKIEKDSQKAVQDALSRARSAAELLKRKAVLAEKQKLIGEVIEKAKASFDTLSEEEYFGIIVKMAQKFALAEEGRILFSKRDYGRLPEGFEAVLNAAIKDKGGKLSISDETRNIDGGFVLVYGGVEENCSFTALFDSAHESLQDKVQALLFS